MDGDVKTRRSSEGLTWVLAHAFGPRAVRSNRLDISLDRARVVFSGKGFGHGVGLCQAGAFARLSQGVKPNAVLSVLLPWRANHTRGLRSSVGSGDSVSIYQCSRDPTPALAQPRTCVLGCSRRPC